MEATDPVHPQGRTPKTGQGLSSEWLTGALLDRLTHEVHILTMNGDSYRLAQSRARKAQAAT